MRFARIAEALYLDPWLIAPSMHGVLCRIFEAHLNGSAHMAEGIVAKWESARHHDMETAGRTDSAPPGNIAVVPIHGVIGKGVRDLEKSSGVTDVGDIAKDIRKAVEAENVAGILLDIDSPGGTVTGVPELASRIAAAATLKPVVAFTDGEMNSAAYWLGSQANAVYSAPSATTGGIGVYQAFLDEAGAYQMSGRRYDVFKSGRFKAMGIPGTSLTDDQRAMLQANIDKVFGWFKTAVTAQRNIPATAMQGQTFRADEAMANDIIDRVGTQEDAISEIMDMAEERKRSHA